MAADRVPGPDHRAAGAATQTEHPWRAVMRTVLAAVVALAAMAPAIYAAATLQSPEAAGGAALAVLTIAGGITRIMALPGVEAFLQRFVPWLAAAPAVLDQRLPDGVPAPGGDTFTDDPQARGADGIIHTGQFGGDPAPDPEPGK